MNTLRKSPELYNAQLHVPRVPITGSTPMHPAKKDVPRNAKTSFGQIRAALRENSGNPSLRDRFIRFLVIHRVLVILAVMAALLLSEIFEHAMLRDYNERVHILFDTVMYSVMVLSIIWFFLILLKRVDQQREQASLANDLNMAFSQQLGSAQTWDDLVRLMVEYAHQNAPQADVTLFVAEGAGTKMRPAVVCSRQGQVTFRPTVNINPDTLPLGSLGQMFRQNGSGMEGYPIGVRHATPADANITRSANRYDVLIMRNEQTLGVIKLEYPDGSTPPTTQIRVIKRAMPVMALALEGALLQIMAAKQADDSDHQRQQIAQDLHDTLAQNISYLRLKLDQFTGENAIREIGALLQEVEQMRAAADEAYQQVRSTLDTLNPVHSVDDVCKAVKAQATVVGARAGFVIHCHEIGKRFALSSHQSQQIIFIAREALHNIEKHAHASHVDLQILWLENELALKISDDGVGFNPSQEGQQGHYGLWIMQQRAQEMGGDLKITPAFVEDDCQVGVEVTLWLPKPSTPIDPDLFIERNDAYLNR